MALLTDDQDIRTVNMWMDIGGNGDYYINMLEDTDNGGKYTSMRVSTSGGNAPLDVKLAIAELYRAMDKHKMNNHPQQSNP